MSDAKRDANYITTLLAVSNADGITPVTLYADPTTHRLLVSVSGGAGHTIQDEGVSLTARTYLNFVGAGVTATDDSGNDATIVTISTSAGAGYQAPSSGTVNGTNAVFVFAVAPNAIVVDGVSLRKTASDTTANWSGTTTITLAVPPNFDIYGVA